MTVLLRTSRLVLRPPEPCDADAWAALDADEVATRFIGGVETAAGSLQGLQSVHRMWESRGASLFSVLETDTGRWVGRVGPWLPDDAIGTEVGWAIDRSAWRKGYATEAAAAAIDWAFEALAWTEVIHCIDRENTASIAVAERLGSRWLRSDVDAGKPVEVYGQNRAAWTASRTRR